jgi:hypothetical protein
MIEHLILISITGDEREKDNVNRDLRLYCFVDKTVKWCFMGIYVLIPAIVAVDYPQRICYQMLNELQDKSLKILNSKYFGLGEKEGSKNDIQFHMAELYRKYTNPSNVDRLIDIRNDVSEIQLTMKDNIKQTINNIDNATV